MSEWIGVEDRLPETDDDVLCWYEYYHFSVDKILPEYGIGYCINGRWGGEVSNGRNTKVLAWMPLPDPPLTKPKAHWIEKNIYDVNPLFCRRFYCSACGDWQTYGKTKYCPNCGERMNLDD